MAPSRPPATGAVVSRRLLLVGTVAAGAGAVLSKLPAGGNRTRPRVVELIDTGAPGTPATTSTVPPPTNPPPGHLFDLVVRGGRVIDPASGYDAVADVGVDAGVVTAISEDALEGRTALDASDRVVAPGFIDLLSYDPNPYGVWYKVADGVTTNLCMHGVNSEAGPWFGNFGSDPPPVHYGGAFDHAWARGQLDVDVGDAASASELAELRAMGEQGLADGWIGVHMEPEYTPGASPGEVRAMGEVAAAAGVGCYFHGRYSDNEPPGTNADTLAEILDVARATGTSVHVEHITSTGGTFTMERSLSTLAAARLEGLDVTACMYPYAFWATTLGSTRFDDGWQERFHISYEDLVVAGTGERLNATTFAQAREDNILAAAVAIPEDDVVDALRSPFVMIGSDAILEEGDNNHPRAAGTFARVLGRFVRDRADISLQDALAKMTILPARRLERAAPAMTRKGRLQVGADADITVFDPLHVADKATLTDPSRESRGIDWVVVAGQVVKDPDGVRRDVRPGRPVVRGG